MSTGQLATGRVIISFVANEALAKQLRAFAFKEQRTLSQTCSLLLQKVMEKREASLHE